VSETFRAKAPWLLYEVTSRLENGIEIYTRKMGEHFFRVEVPQWWPDHIRRDPSYVKKRAVDHMYVFEDKPHWSQVLSVELYQNDLSVAIRIQRGHYIVANFIATHCGHAVILDAVLGKLICQHCNDFIDIDPRSIPSRPPPKII
jgi:hypothetical protein